MQPAISRTADSLVGSLCREIEAVRQRARQLLVQLGRCRDADLRRRLQGELVRLELRRRELDRSVRTLEGSGLKDRLALAFLRELSRRPLGAAAL
ncbi:MAG: hypothetical protein ER33_14990 [Cyanobium sp. CACIAM 14]|nr:MAG: hypothetical protein ER33_14990 [Cyanobium sp. CACIAM 14]